MTRSFDIDEWLVLVVIALVIVAISGCACQDNRLVQPVSWHELDRTDLAVVCRDTDPAIRGCVVSRVEGDHIYVLDRGR